MLHVLITFPLDHPTPLTLGAIITFLLTVGAIAVVVALMGIIVGLIERRRMQKMV